jgi:hypothetical protein
MMTSPFSISATADLGLEPIERAREIALLLELPAALVAQFRQPLESRLRIAERVVDDNSVERLQPAGRAWRRRRDG